MYQRLQQQIAGLLDNETHWLANLANCSALLNQELDNINWVGFYLSDGNETLVLGPFHGLPACTRIPFGQGVCGTAVSQKSTQRVADVHAFPGHIACDVASRSELVIPLVVNGKVIGVLDIDSPSLNRFSEEDQAGLEALVNILLAGTVFPASI